MQELEILTELNGLGSIRKIVVEALISQAKSRAARPFRFLSLPAELRDMIYSYALVPYTENLIHKDLYRARTPEGRRSRGVAWLEPPALTQVSSQVRKESLAIYLGRNTFNVYTDLDLLGARWLSTRLVQGLPRLNAQPDLVRKVVLSMSFCAIDTIDPDLSHRFDLTISRNVDGTAPRYVVSAEPPPWCRRDWEERQEMLVALTTHVERCAFSVLNDTQEVFDYTPESVKRFLEKMPGWITYKIPRPVDNRL